MYHHVKQGVVRLLNGLTRRQNGCYICMILIGMVISCCPVKAQWRVLYSSTEIGRETIQDTIDPITSIDFRGEFSKNLVVKYAHSRRKLVPVKNVWGFTDGKTGTWRIDRHDLCRIVDINQVWVEYEIQRSKNNRSVPTVWFESVFSRTLTSKIYNTWQEAMREIPQGYILRRGVSVN